MALVRYTLEVGKELTYEEHEALAVRLREAASRPYTYDPDCPLLTPEQLAEFMPVNGMTWEERNRRMKERDVSGSSVGACPGTAQENRSVKKDI